MKFRVLEGYTISDETIYCFGDLTAVVTFKDGQIDRTLLGATYGDFSDEALSGLLKTGQTLNEVQDWLAYIEPDAIRSIRPKTMQVVEAILAHSADTFYGADGSGKAWIIGFDGSRFAFAPNGIESDPVYIAADELRIVSRLSITSTKLDANTFVVNSPTVEMEKWLSARVATCSSS